jgi:predicted transposase/invertase (TIGR01784 family)
MSKLQNPHDIFTKIMLSDPKAARVFLHRFLPIVLSDKLDFRTLNPVDQSFLSDDMKETFADLVFECRLREEHDGLPLYLSILIEHKSYPDEHVSFQMGHYTMSGYKKQIANKVHPLKPIIPFLYYHGNQEWIPKRLVDFFDLYPLHVQKYTPDYEFVYQDITRMRDDEIRALENDVLIPGLLMQKYHKNLQHLLDLTDELLQYLGELGSTGNLQTTYYVYLFDLFEDKKEEFMKKFKETIWPTKDRSKNYIMQILDKGVEEGKEEEKVHTIKNLIKEGLGTEFIARVTEVTPEYVEDIRMSMEGS